MKLFWYPVAFFCCLLFAGAIFIINFPALVYNLVHRTKKRISWDLMSDTRSKWKVKAGGEIFLDEHEKHLG